MLPLAIAHGMLPFAIVDTTSVDDELAQQRQKKKLSVKQLFSTIRKTFDKSKTQQHRCSLPNHLRNEKDVDYITKATKQNNVSSIKNNIRQSPLVCDELDCRSPSRVDEKTYVKHVISYESDSPVRVLNMELDTVSQSPENKQKFYVCVQFEALKNATEVTKESLSSLLKCFGNISSCKLECSAYSKCSGLQYGWGRVYFTDPNNALLAAKAMGKITIANVSYYCYAISSDESYTDLQIEMATDFCNFQNSSTSSAASSEYYDWDSTTEDYPNCLQI